MRRRRLAALVALAAVIAAGLLVHKAMSGSTATDVAGDALYAVAAFTGLVLLFPRAPRFALAGAAALWCVGVELLQLTGVPLAIAERVPPVTLLLGTGFDARDLVVYVCAAAVAGMTDAATGRALRRDT